MKTTYRITTQRELRSEFWATFQNLERKTGSQNNQPADTRATFVDWVVSLQRNGEISEKLSDTATL